MAYLWDIISIRITIDNAGEGSITARNPLPGAKIVGTNKLVSTLTSKIDVINLLMVGAKQHGDMGLSWFRPRGRTSSRLRVCVVLRCTGGGCRGGLQASKSLLDD
jgi:hypothetical protein